MLSDTKHAQIKHLYPNPQMIEFHIHQQFDPSWQKLAQYITTIWPKDNMCIVAQPEQIDAIIKAISTHPTRLMLCTTKPSHSAMIYVTDQQPSNHHWVINTSSSQLATVHVEWVTELSAGRERYKYWRDKKHSLEVFQC